MTNKQIPIWPDVTKWRVCWLFGAVDVPGQVDSLTEEEATALADSLNEKYPGVFHWAEPVELPETA